MVVIKHKGNFERSTKFLNNLFKFEVMHILRKYGEKGVQALAEATPKDTGRTAESWSYEIAGSKGNYSITWKNSNVNRGINIAVILDTGHGTGTGGYVAGKNYIDPTIQPIFEQIANDAWREVTDS